MFKSVKPGSFLCHVSRMSDAWVSQGCAQFHVQLDFIDPTGFSLILSDTNFINEETFPGSDLFRFRQTLISNEIDRHSFPNMIELQLQRKTWHKHILPILIIKDSTIWRALFRLCQAQTSEYSLCPSAGPPSSRASNMAPRDMWPVSWRPKFRLQNRFTRFRRSTKKHWVEVFSTTFTSTGAGLLTQNGHFLYLAMDCSTVDLRKDTVKPL